VDGALDRWQKARSDTQIVPAAMGFVAVSFGVPTSEIYYFTGFSYLAMIIWLIRWRFLCLKAEN
jgi:hypothetical protein